MATVISAINAMVRGSGKNRQQISLEMGRSKTYLTATVQKKVRPRTDVLVEIAKACGYKLQLVGHDETIVIDNKSES